MDKELPKGILDEEKQDTDSEPERGSDEEASGSDAEEAASLPPSQQLESEPASITSTKPMPKCNVWFCVSSLFFFFLFFFMWGFDCNFRMLRVDCRVSLVSVQRRAQKPAAVGYLSWRWVALST